MVLWFSGSLVLWFWWFTGSDGFLVHKVLHVVPCMVLWFAWFSVSHGSLFDGSLVHMVLWFTGSLVLVVHWY